MTIKRYTITISTNPQSLLVTYAQLLLFNSVVHPGTSDTAPCGRSILAIDIACTHGFSGNHRRDVTRNGQLRDSDVNKLLETTARTKVERYRDSYVLMET